ncbi:MAG: ABC transporter permease [archaeon YNP-LCB-024-027]|nr:ABC transporter permease [Candidatus Culexarchaeum yellowstonense]
MHSVLMVILKKEVKEMLRDPKILIGMIIAPVLLMGVMSGVMNFVMSSAKEAVLNPNVIIVDYDNSLLSNIVTSSLTSSSGGRVMVIGNLSVSKAIDLALSKDFSTVMVIPRGFGYNVSIGRRAIVELYTVMKSLSISESGASSMPSSIIEFLNSEIVRERIREVAPNIDPEVFLKPISRVEYSVVKGRVINVSPQIVFSVVMSQSIFIPIIIMIIFITAMQFASTSIALEKEYKTLETLLTLPVSRFTILLAKLMSSVMLAVLGSVSFMFAYTYYYTSVTSFGLPTINLSLSDIGLAMTPIGLLLTGLTLFLSMVSSLVLALLIAVFAEDVRSAQTLVGYLYFLMIVPMMVSMFTDVNSLPISLQIPLYLIPYTYTLASPRAALLENYSFLIIGIVYMVVFSMAVLYIASKFFKSEKVLTAKISFRRFRR